jgi:hypothetical protein
VYFVGVLSEGGAVVAVVTVAQVRTDHPLLEAFAILLLTPRLAAVATFEMSGGWRHCILVVGSRLFNFESEGQRVPLQDTLLGFTPGS